MLRFLTLFLFLIPFSLNACDLIFYFFNDGVLGGEIHITDDNGTTIINTQEEDGLFLSVDGNLSVTCVNCIVGDIAQAEFADENLPTGGFLYNYESDGTPNHTFYSTSLPNECSTCEDIEGVSCDADGNPNTMEVFEDCKCLPSMTLPIESTDLIIKEGFINIATFRSPNEVNVDSYELERSKDLSKWYSEGLVKAIGKEIYKFTFKHKKGLSYFRLKIINRDGSLLYTPIISHTFKGNERIFFSIDGKKEGNYYIEDGQLKKIIN